MSTARLVVTGIAVLMVVVSAGIFWKQATAKSCPAHNRSAGALAAIIGWGLLILSFGLVVSCWAFNYRWIPAGR
jgi:hypothetical protein